LLIPNSFRARASRRRRRKREEKRRIDLIDKHYKEQLDDTNRKLAEKLLKVLDGEVSVGVRDLDGGAVIRSGVTFKSDTFSARLDETRSISLSVTTGSKIAAR